MLASKRGKTKHQFLCRDIRDRSILRVFEGDGVNGQGAGPPSGSVWDSTESYFSEPEMESGFQQHQANQGKSSKVKCLLCSPFI